MWRSWQDSGIPDLFEDNELSETKIIARDNDISNSSGDKEPLEIKERTEGNLLEAVKVKTEETNLEETNLSDVKILSGSKKGRKKKKKYRKHKKQEEQLKQKNTEENPLEVNLLKQKR